MLFIQNNDWAKFVVHAKKKDWLKSVVHTTK